MFNYIFKGNTHTDTTREYMLSIGMDADQIESVLSQQQYEAQQNVELRQQAYKRESDPLYIEWQFELESKNPDADKYKQAWMDKVSEIKVRFPIPQ